MDSNRTRPFHRRTLTVAVTTAVVALTALAVTPASAAPQAPQGVVTLRATSSAPSALPAIDLGSSAPMVHRTRAGGSCGAAMTDA